MRGHWHGLSALSFAVVQLAQTAHAADPPYVSDLEIFSSLAPCAATAITAAINAVTYSTTECADGESKMHSCVCSNSADFAAVSSSLASSVTYSCSVTKGLTDDMSSASVVLKQYCSPDLSLTFSKPKRNVAAIITEIAEKTNLAPCAQSAVQYVVMGAGYDRCPEDASLWAPCICSKSGVVDDISRSLSSYARSTCSNNEDATSARQFYSDYCAMNEGTTKFAEAAKPPGDMSYHVTALPQFKSLKSCGQSAVEEVVLIQTALYCPPGPQALASCVCLKSGMFGRVSSSMTESVKYSCGSTAIDDVTSAVEVFEYYCSAADNKVSVSVNVESTSTTENPASTPTDGAQSKSRSTGPAETGGADLGSSSGKESGESRVNRTAVIAASVLGAFLFILIIAAVVFYIRRKRRRASQGEEIPSAPAGPAFEEFKGKPELAGPDPVVARPGTGNVDVDTLKAELPTAASYTELSTPTTPNQASNPAFPSRQSAAISDISPTPTDTLRPELPTTTPQAPGVPPMPRPYAQSPQDLVSPVGGQQYASYLQAQPVHEAPAPSPVSPQSLRGSPANGFTPYRPPMSQDQAMGWQSGPVESYEMDATPSNRDR